MYEFAGLSLCLCLCVWGFFVLFCLGGVEGVRAMMTNQGFRFRTGFLLNPNVSIHLFCHWVSFGNCLHIYVYACMHICM